MIYNIPVYATSFPIIPGNLKFGLHIDVPYAERSKSEIRVILNTIELNTTEKSIQAFEKIVYKLCSAKENIFFI